MLRTSGLVRAGSRGDLGMLGNPLEIAVHLEERLADKLDQAKSLSVQADLFFAKSDYDSAEAYYWAALELKEQAVGASHLLVASSLHDLGELYETRQDLGKAIQMYEWALHVRENLLGRYDLQVRREQRKLARLCAMHEGLSCLLASLHQKTESFAVISNQNTASLGA